MKLFAAILVAGALLVASIEASQFGTGFAISPKGYLITCHHVVRGADRILVHTAKGPVPAQIVALDPRNDLAVLKIPEWSGRFLGISSSGEVSHASEVLAAGFPDPTVLGINPKISKGIVSSLSGVRDDPRYLQISAPLQPGNSGGPVLSPSGRVVGVVAAGLNTMDRMTHGGYLPQSVNFAIKADLILPLLKSASVSLPRFGTRTQGEVKQVQRAIEAVVLVESFRGQQFRSLIRPSAGPPPVIHSVPPVAQRHGERGGPWVFPDSHLRALSAHEVERLPVEGLWRARNEIYLRRGFHFTSPEGRQFAAQFGPVYQPRTTSVDEVARDLSAVEVANLQLISAHERRLER